MNFLKTVEGRKRFALVVASPEDDAPRAELAEWLRERQDPLGEFIALQLKKKKNPKREARLRMDHEADWLGAVHGIVDGQSIVFERGFVTSLRIEAPHDAPNREFLAELRAATGHAALSLVKSLSLGPGVLEGYVHTRMGGLLQNRDKGTKIPIVGFLAHPVLDRLERLEVGYQPRGNVRAGLKAARPRLHINSVW
ncbi:MAG: hypothetical protein QM817_25390 [Archangium sp.]